MTIQAATTKPLTSKRTRGSTIEYRTFTFWILLAAQTVSALYQLYRSTIMEAPEYDAFGVSVMVAYAMLFGLVFLVRVGKRWTWWLTLLWTTAMIAFGIFYYFPNVTAARLFGPIDWIEGIVYEGLLFVASVMSILNIAGLTITRDTRPA